MADVAAAADDDADDDDDDDGDGQIKLGGPAMIKP